MRLIEKWTFQIVMCRSLNYMNPLFQSILLFVYWISGLDCTNSPLSWIFSFPFQLSLICAIGIFHSSNGSTIRTLSIRTVNVRTSWKKKIQVQFNYYCWPSSCTTHVKTLVYINQLSCMLITVNHLMYFSSSSLTL